MMPKTPDRAMLSRLLEAYDRIAEESLGLGDPEFHEIDDRFYEAIVDTPFRAVIKHGDIYLPDPNGLKDWPELSEAALSRFPEEVESAWP